MASVLSIPILPSPAPPFVFADPTARNILATDTLWFLHGRREKKIFGPFRTVAKKGRTILTGDWRRGVSTDSLSCLRLRGLRGAFRLSPMQERHLLEDLAKVNRPVLVPDLWFFDLDGRRTRLRMVSYHPFRTAEWSWPCHPTKVAAVAEEIKTALAALRGPSGEKALLAVEEAGRRLFRHVVKDPEAGRLLAAETTRPALLVPQGPVAAWPLELMHSSAFLGLLRPVSRSAGYFGGTDSPACSGPIPPFLFLSAQGEDPVLPDRLSGIFGHAGCPAVTVGMLPKTLPALLASTDEAHVIAHGSMKGTRYLWENRIRTKVFDPEAGRTPAFLFSHACNRHFFSERFQAFLDRLARSGTETWVGPWSDIDYASPLFAEAFYASFLGGASAAEAVTTARRDLWSLRRSCEALLFGCAGNPLRKKRFAAPPERHSRFLRT